MGIHLLLRNALLDAYKNGTHLDDKRFEIYITYMRGKVIELDGGDDFYISIDGELCGLFAITYTRDRLTAASLGSLCSYRKLQTVITAGDFMLTESFIRGKFGVKTRRMCFPDRMVRAELRGVEADETAPALALMTQDGLASMAYAVSGAHSLRAASRAGAWLHLIAGALGLGIMLTMTVLGAFYLLTPVNVFLYQLIFMVPGLLTTEWTRAI
jgi:hypothetical protein